MKNLTQKLCFVVLLITSLNAYCQIPKLSSNQTGQTPTIFLDFDGQTVQSYGWQSGTSFVCAPAVLTATQITEIFNRVSEDYRPFNVNITTDSADFIAAPFAQRVRIIVTPTSSWYPNAGGVAYIGSFTWGDDTPGFVFTDKLGNVPKNIAECCTHESGHALGLSHQARFDVNCNLTEQYNSGTGSGETSWAPVMGNSYGRNMTGWGNGPTPYDCMQNQDNLTVISTQNGFGYRVDDYSDSLNSNTTSISSSGFNLPGIITTTTDKDAFKIVITQAGNIHIDISPYNIGANNSGANLDVMMTLYNSSKVIIGTYNPLNSMKVILDTSLNVGTYYMVVAGAGNNNTTNYGSLGSYTLSGYRGALPIHSVNLQGSNEGNNHKFNWDIIADEQIASQVLEVSTNGYDFKAIMNDVTGIQKFVYTPTEKGTLFYRLKVTSVINQVMYSNIISLKSNVTNEKLFSVTTIVQESINVNAKTNFTYNLFDANARLIATGKNLKGNSNINVINLSRGMYILQMMSDNNYKQTERIIRQ